MIVFIDWISTPDHKNFNRAFFSSLGIKHSKCFVFSKKLIIAETDCIYLPPSQSRIIQLTNILKLVWSNRKNQIIFLTYDPFFLPIVSLIKRNVIVFEHNTTPERILSKHFIWQWLLFRKVYRIAQFPKQYSRLQFLSNNVFYMGSPLMRGVYYDLDLASTAIQPPFLFIAPSYRANIAILYKYAFLMPNSTVIVKKSVNTKTCDAQADKLTIKPLERIDFEHNGRHVDAAIITVQSRIRGTGWFNDCISNCMPIIIIDDETKLLFEETFPNYPYIFLEDVKSTSELSNFFYQVRRFQSENYILRHNSILKFRFIDMCRVLKIKQEN